MEEVIEEQELQKNPEEGAPNSENGEQELSQDEIAELKKKADVSSQNFERAKKAEAELKALKTIPKVEEKKKEFEGNLSVKDTLALFEAKVSSEDFDEVVEYAAFRKVSIPEALKSSTLKIILNEKAEFRQSDLAKQMKSPRSSPNVTGESLIEKARRGELPTDDAGIAKLAQAEQDAKLAKQK